MNLIGSLHVHKIGAVRERKSSSQLLNKNNKYPTRVAKPVKVNEYSVNTAAVQRLA